MRRLRNGRRISSSSSVTAWRANTYKRVQFCTSHSTEILWKQNNQILRSSMNVSEKVNAPSPAYSSKSAAGMRLRRCIISKSRRLISLPTVILPHDKNVLRFCVYFVCVCCVVPCDIFWGKTSALPFGIHTSFRVDRLVLIQIEFFDIVSIQIWVSFIVPDSVSILESAGKREREIFINFSSVSIRSSASSGSS